MAGQAALRGQGEVQVQTPAAKAPQKEQKTGSAPSASVPIGKPSKLYVRLTGDRLIDRRVDALVSIFEGQIPCIYYDRATATYKDSGKRVSPSPYWLSVLKELAGEENVVLK